MNEVNPHAEVSPASPTPEELDRYVEIWKKAVDTQMHFNEMSVKSRQLGLTFVAAALGVAVVLLSRGGDFSIDFYLNGFPIRLHVAIFLAIAAAIAMQAVRRLDLHVYHKMLRGAVTFGEDFEQNYLKHIFNLEKGMTQAISHFSRFEDASVTALDGRYKYQHGKETTAQNKLASFYNRTIWFLVLAAVGLFLFSNLPLWLKDATSEATPTPVQVEANEEGAT